MPGRRGRPRLTIAALAFALVALLSRAERAPAQESTAAIRAARLLSTPLGALPPLALPMPASRNHNYWAARLAVGQLRGSGANPLALGGGIDLQWRGGSVFGLTAGYVQRKCGTAAADCRGHPMFGARARLNFITSGPTIASVIGDYTATSTLGTEIGFGYAPGIRPGVDACTVDAAAPFSVAMLQSVRLAAFISPGAMLDIRCSAAAPSTGLAFFTGLGVGVQQLATRGLDVHLGLRRIFQARTGYTLGVTVSYTRLP